MAEILFPPPTAPEVGAANAPQSASPDREDLAQDLVNTMQAIFGKHQGYRTSKGNPRTRPSSSQS